ncbi:unnamed protein product [Periconia digitata]|uniref:Uncharacterized protein n=1 Tax=Periconia digitata TaxID=1303443 RepID=A0A9W4U676_9PLEO|nr:unnamed protein product [Periconia digitata]
MHPLPLLSHNNPACPSLQQYPSKLVPQSKLTDTGHVNEAFSPANLLQTSPHSVMHGAQSNFNSTSKISDERSTYKHHKSRKHESVCVKFAGQRSAAYRSRTAFTATVCVWYRTTSLWRMKSSFNVSVSRYMGLSGVISTSPSINQFCAIYILLNAIFKPSTLESTNPFGEKNMSRTADESTGYGDASRKNNSRVHMNPCYPQRMASQQVSSTAVKDRCNVHYGFNIFRDNHQSTG